MLKLHKAEDIMFFEQVIDRADREFSNREGFVSVHQACMDSLFKLNGS